ncbi:MAG: glycosyltransferase family 2 protein [Bacteroidota bacterium]
MTPISVVIITLNEEKNIERCIRSVNRIADEIIVVDSLSKDKTVSIAESLGAKVISQSFLGYVAQKNFAAQQASHDWVLSLDADEALSPELEQNIIQIKQQSKHNGYRLCRRTNYCGHWIKHCGWYPDKKLRLYNRNKATWLGEKIHERLEMNDTNDSVGELSGDLLHYSYYTISDHIKQIENFTELTSREAVERGNDVNVLMIMIAPKWKFFSDYIIRLGFLDGLAGYQVCRLSAMATFIKYSKIKQYAKSKREGKPY